MKEIYIFRDSKLSKKDDTIYMESENKKEYIPVASIDVIHIFGDFSCTKPLLELIARYDIILYLYNYVGKCVGIFTPSTQKGNGTILLSQCRAYDDIEKRISIARQIVIAATETMIENLKYYNRRGKKLEEEITSIKYNLSILASQTSVEHIMAIEGRIHTIYYSAFNKIITQDGFEFTVRSRKPPKDPVNTLISFLNTLVYNEVLSQIFTTSLSPAISYLHSSNERKYSLNLDIAELFKPILTDQVIFSVLNKKMIQKEDFVVKDGVYMKENAKRLLVEQFHHKLCTSIQQSKQEKPTTYQQLIRQELMKLQRYLIDGEGYLPYVKKG